MKIFIQNKVIKKTISTDSDWISIANSTSNHMPSTNNSSFKNFCRLPIDK